MCAFLADRWTYQRKAKLVDEGEDFSRIAVTLCAVALTHPYQGLFRRRSGFPLPHPLEHTYQ